MSEIDKQPKAGEPKAKDKTKNEGTPKEQKADKQPKAGEPKKEEVLSKMERTKRALAAQPKVRIIIPYEPGEEKLKDKSRLFETVQINGYTYQIRKGVYVEVPQQIADIIMEARNETDAAYERAKQTLTDEERPEFNNG